MSGTILFTQYLMPDGRRTPIKTERPDNIVALANEIIKRGSRFEAEMLRDGVTISFTVTNPDNSEPDIAILLVKNGPDVPKIVDALVVKAAKWHRIIKDEDDDPRDAICGED